MSQERLDTDSLCTVTGGGKRGDTLKQVNQDMCARGKDETQSCFSELSAQRNDHAQKSTRQTNSEETNLTDELHTPQGDLCCGGSISKHLEINMDIGKVQYDQDAADTEYWQKKIEDNRSILMDSLDLESTILLDYLMEWKVITKEKVHDMSTKNSIVAGKRMFLDHLLTRNEDDFGKFCEALHKTKQSHIANFLEKKPQKQVILKIRLTPSRGGDAALEETIRDLYFKCDQTKSGGNTLNIVLQTESRWIEEVRAGCVEIVISCETVQALDELWDLVSQGEIRRAVVKDLIELKGLDLVQATTLPIEVIFDYEKYLSTRKSLWKPERDGPWAKDLRFQCAQSIDEAPCEISDKSSQGENKPATTDHIGTASDLSSTASKETDKADCLCRKPDQKLSEIYKDKGLCKRCGRRVTMTNELICKHLFCQTCLNYLSASWPCDRITCPVCWEPTPLPPIGVAGLDPVIVTQVSGEEGEQKIQTC